ncbi:SDR family NAD(P)-dependent oxidoreductase [Rubinisphaera sp. JC750]|uniref:SDR family NAD(P)-dependent oxidoreductase n=1 Tax=Rubinisphaera sp. JC750 TaxID=2898658 RepID=UPI001F4357E4|nr:SDR family oxidoreductase [Rubinisphaera sp. JC750]
MKCLEGKNAIVTGASKGIGAAIAVGLAEAGANVAINYCGSTQAAERVAERCRKAGVNVRLAQADVGCQSEVERIVDETVEEFGELDIAVSNAAYSDRELFYEADMEGFEKTVQVTMWGAFYLLRAAANRMIESRTQGSIVIVSSPHSWRPIPGAMAYNMSKAAIDQMAKTAATELCNKRIRVNIMHPGWIDTPGERKFFSEEKLQTLGTELPWGRLGKPEEIARGVVFLCDPASDYMTGSSMLIDGGIELPVEEMHRLETPEAVAENRKAIA